MWLNFKKKSENKKPPVKIKSEIEIKWLFDDIMIFLLYTLGFFGKPIFFAFFLFSKVL